MDGPHPEETRPLVCWVEQYLQRLVEPGVVEYLYVLAQTLQVGLFVYFRKI